MARVYRTNKVHRSIFRKLAFGALYWVSGTTNVAPSLKLSRTGKLASYSSSTGAPTETTVDGTTAVVKVPEQFCHGC